MAMPAFGLGIESREIQVVVAAGGRHSHNKDSAGSEACCAVRFGTADKIEAREVRTCYIDALYDTSSRGSQG